MSKFYRRAKYEDTEIGDTCGGKSRWFRNEQNIPK